MDILLSVIVVEAFVLCHVINGGQIRFVLLYSRDGRRSMFFPWYGFI